VLDSTKAFKKLIENKADVAGLQQTSLDLAAQTAKTNGHETATAEAGPWLITLDYPSYIGVMQHAQSRSLREEVYRARIQVASAGDQDNTPVINEILALRKERALLLSYANHGEVSLATKMATLEDANGLLEDLRNRSFGAAERDQKEVQAYADRNGFAGGKLQHWDLSFWAERLRESKFDLKDEDLRPYFPLPSVTKGLFDLANRLFDVTIKAVEGKTEVWNKDVQYFEISDNEGQAVASFYLDPYSRPAEKRGGAWMSGVVDRSSTMAPAGCKARLPVAHMVCNGTPPTDTKPSLMTHREVETLFHEFGHALQHMLTTQDSTLVSGINGIEWDAVELPSQFMENWCYHEKTVMEIAKHFETGESLPKDMFDKLVAARTFRAGTAMLRCTYVCMYVYIHYTCACMHI
jgi:oligopeptidase A